MPTYEHLCKACDYEWDDVYSMVVDPPTICPSCEEDGQVKRLISGGSGRGIVILKGGDLRAKLMGDAQQARMRARTDEKFRASIIGDEKYHQQQLGKDNLTDQLVKIGKDASKVKSISKKGVVKRVSDK